MDPFRELLKRNTHFYWDSHMSDLFYRSRKLIVQKVKDGVKAFEVGRKTMLTPDWSKTGIGFFLEQKHCDCDMLEAPHCGPDHWRLILSGSRFCKDAETRYRPVEGEALAIAYALEATRMFTLGNPELTIGTDHKPLVSIMGPKNLEEIKNPRVRAMKDKTLMYKFNMMHVPGPKNKGPDATSRYPSQFTNLCDFPPFLVHVFTQVGCRNPLCHGTGFLASNLAYF